MISIFDKHPQRHQGGNTKDGVGKHIDNDVWGEPRTLQSRHQRLAVDFGFEEVNADEHQCKDGREREYTLITPTGIDDDACQRQEEGIPEARLAHCTQWRTLQRNSHHQDKTEEYDEAQDSRCIDQRRLLTPSCPGSYGPQQDCRYCEICKLFPTNHHSQLSIINFIFLPNTKRQTAPVSII